MGSHGDNAIKVAVVLALVALATGLGLTASRWRRNNSNSGAGLHTWGLGGGQFGPLLTWFLLGGDFYTSYTVVAVPSAVYAVGAYGYFAVPYTIIVYPIVFTIMPLLWKEARSAGLVTAPDVVRARHGSRLLELAMALTGILATMPYIALQLVGVQVVVKALGLPGELSLIVAFGVLALYTYAGGLLAPTRIAIFKDVMIGIVAVVAMCVVPFKLGGYGSVFASARDAFAAKAGSTTPAGLTLKPGQMLPFATQALGSAFAAFIYPHTFTGVLAAKNTRTIRMNAVTLPIYTVVLALIALMGYMAIAAHVKVDNGNDVVPALFDALFPAWFVGVAYAAIAISALVPASVMSIGASNIYTRNVWKLWKAYRKQKVTLEQEEKNAKLASLFVKFLALAFFIYQPPKLALDWQLLGGNWILQTFPALVLGMFWRRWHANALFAGWLAGIVFGTWIAFDDGIKSVHTLVIGGDSFTVYTGLLALLVNIAVAALLHVVLPAQGSADSRARLGTAGGMPLPATQA